MPRRGSPPPSVSASIHSIAQSDFARRRRLRQWRLFACKRTERNPVAAMLTLLSATLVAAALFDPQWLTLDGGHCPLKFLGTTLFYRSASFKREKAANNDQHIYYIVDSHRYVDCVTPSIANIFYGLIGICFVTFGTAFVAFVFEALGPRHGFLKWLRRNVVFSVCTVILSSVIVLLTYWVSSKVEQLQRNTSHSPQSVVVSFGEGFYLIVASGTLAIFSVAASLHKTLRRLQRKRTGDMERLVGNYSNPVDPLPNDIVAETERQRIRIFENYLMSVTEQNDSQIGDSNDRAVLHSNNGSDTPTFLLPPPPPYSP